jgi:DNA repair protein RadC
MKVYETRLVKIGEFKNKIKEINNQNDATKIVHEYLDGKDRENVIVLMLGVRNNIIGVETVSVGTPMGSSFFLSSIIKPALLSGATKIIVGHNHPLGDATIPTQGDMEFNMNLQMACSLMGLELTDNIIVDQEGRSLSLVQVMMMEQEFMSLNSAEN